MKRVQKLVSQIMDGILLLHKKPGVTSFQALSPLKKKFPQVKIGHCGTLDRFASGLLIVLLGRMTRLNSVFSGLDKAYRSTFRFGEETDTLDPEGQIVRRADLPEPGYVFPIQDLCGEQKQIPPVYSAIHVNGRRASERARRGQVVEMPTRDICVHALAIETMWPDVSVDVICSKGTYIRSLARDFGVLSGSCARVQNLERYWVGDYSAGLNTGFHLDDAHFIEDVSAGCVLPMAHIMRALPHVCILRVANNLRFSILNGQPLREDWFGSPVLGGQALIFDENNEFLALIRKEDGRLRYQFVAGDQV
ncbi:MAG: tRNA pseudouridine(55) synthase TruB [Spirochaetia bacterium]